MKLNYFIPLIIFILLTGFGVLSSPPPVLTQTVQFIGFILSFCFIYIIGITQTLRNADAVVKINNRSPYLVPLL